MARAADSFLTILGLLAPGYVASPRRRANNPQTALGAVVTRLPSITDLDQDPTEVISTGDWVKVDADNGVIEITKR